MLRRNPFVRTTLMMLLAATMAGLTSPVLADEKKSSKEEDPYAEFVWPPPPDEARIRLVDVIFGRKDVEAESKLKRMLFGRSPGQPYDRLKKPYAVAIDSTGRLLVTDTALAAILRFDRREGRMDVFGTRGTVTLRAPLGLCTAPDDTVFVADVGLKKVVAFDPEGKLIAVFGKKDELTNPTDVALSPDGSKLFVTDSKAHSIVVYDRATASILHSFGQRGEGEGDLNFPTSLAFGPEGNLLVVDQINARVQVFSEEGELLDAFGERGTGYGNFARPKDIAVDEHGIIYVTDNAFNNVQLFDYDFSLLTFVGEGGRGPGRFHGASGIAVRGDQIAVIDQLGHRLQLFEYLSPRGGR